MDNASNWNWSNTTTIRNGTRPARGPPRNMTSDQSRNCYTCYGTCMYKSIELLFIIGILANIIVVIRVTMDKKIRKPTYVAIACLALSDALFLSINSALSLEIVVRSLTCAFPAILDGSVYRFIRGLLWFSANGHISLMASVRYILIVYPLKANAYLTNKSVLKASLFTWVLGILFYGIMKLLEQYSVISSLKSADVLTVIWTIVFLAPLLITAFLHCVKLRRLRQSTKRTATGNNRVSVLRMSKIIMCIIILGLVLPFPKFAHDVLFRMKTDWPSGEFQLQFREIATLLFLLNNCINPFIYAFMSKPFRASLKLMICR